MSDISLIFFYFKFHLNFPKHAFSLGVQGSHGGSGDKGEEKVKWKQTN